MIEIKPCPFCGDCFWYSDITVHMCELENDPTSEDAEACSLFEQKEEE